MIKLFSISCLFVHLFSCFFYLTAKINDLNSTTWVYRQNLDLEHSVKNNYVYAIYWASQTLTTVGYGDFGAKNPEEMFVTVVWMLIGAALYSVVVGSLTSVIIDANSVDEELNRKLKALEVFAQ
jgi:voltage-gated potassium channel Kch